VSRRKKPRVKFRQQAATNLPAPVNAVTVGLAASERPTSFSWADEQTTNAPRIGEPEPSEGYAGSTPELAHRFLAGKVPLRIGTIWLVITIAWFVAIAWLFQQDNAAGKIDGWPGIRWFLAKSLVVTGFALVAGVVGAVVARVTRRSADAT
jgi:hypothetical protein